MNRRLASALAALGVWAALPPAAQAGEGECLFQRTPAVHRDALYAKYFSNDLVAQIELIVPLIEGVAAAAKACGFEKAPAGFTDEAWGRAVSAVWIGYVMDDLGSRRLQARYRVSRAQLDAVWSELSPARRRSLADYMQKLGLERLTLSEADHRQFVDLVHAVDPDYDVLDLFLGAGPDGIPVPDFESKGYAVITHFMGRAVRLTDLASPARPEADPALVPRPTVHADVR